MLCGHIAREFGFEQRDVHAFGRGHVAVVAEGPQRLLQGAFFLGAGIARIFAVRRRRAKTVVQLVPGNDAFALEEHRPEQLQAEARAIRVVVLWIHAVDDELALRYRNALEHVLTRQQLQPCGAVLVVLHVDKATLGPRHHALGHDQVIAHSPNDFGYRETREQRLQQLLAQLIEGESLQDGRDGFCVLRCLGIVLNARLHLPAFTHQGELSLLQS